MPACWLGTVTVHSDHHIFWVMRGTAKVLAGGEVHDLAAREALWIPPGVPVDQISTEPGSVAFTVLLPSRLFPDFPAGIVRRTLTGPLCDLLLYLHSRWVTPSWREAAVTPGIAVTLRRVFSGPGRPAVSFPVTPVSPPAVAVARQLVDDPADRRTLRELAAETDLSPRHLTRIFSTETGMSFGEWRVELKLAVAARMLADGTPAGRAAAAVGYTSPASFSRAFRARTGTTPGAFRSVSGGPVAARPDAVTVPEAPAATLLPLVNRVHVLVWMARGSARVRLRGREVTVARGQLMWFPAGVWHELTTSPGGVLLCLGTLPLEVPLTHDHAVPFSCPGIPEEDLLYRASVMNTLLRPYPWDPGEFTGELAALLPPVGHRDRSPSVAAILRDDAEGHQTLATWSRRLGPDTPELARLFRRDTGQSYREWKVDRRMTEARALLRDPGRSVEQVASAVGYRSAISFNRVFRAHHGMTPGQFRRDRLARSLFEAVE